MVKVASICFLIVMTKTLLWQTICNIFKNQILFNIPENSDMKLTTITVKGVFLFFFVFFPDNIIVKIV